MTAASPRPVTPDAEASVLALISACRRRGLKAEHDPAIDGGVIVSHTPRVIALRLMENRWYRDAPDQLGRSVQVGSRGAEDFIARHLADSLLGPR